MRMDGDVGAEDDGMENVCVTDRITPPPGMLEKRLPSPALAFASSFARASACRVAYLAFSSSRSFSAPAEGAGAVIAAWPCVLRHACHAASKGQALAVATEGLRLANEKSVGQEQCLITVESDLARVAREASTNDATIKLAHKVVRVGSPSGPGSAAGSTTLEVLPTAEFFATGGVTPGK